MTTTAQFDTFGPLRLDIDTLDAGANFATSVLNVDFDNPGRIRTRSGATRIATLAATTVGGTGSFEPFLTGGPRVIVGYTTGGTITYSAYRTAGTVAATTNVPTSAVVNSVRFGTPANERLYIANGADTIWKYIPDAFSQPAGMPIATHLATTASSNRLVAANIVGTSISRVAFSDAGAPETWTSTSTVELTPGDGSGINGLARWQDNVFAFKRDRFFVFYGESTASTGTPVFNYRMVDGYGTSSNAVAGLEGVYFFDGASIWVTNGGPPTRVSQAIEPFLRGEVSISIWTVDTSAVEATQLTYSTGRLYVAVKTLTFGYVTLVFDPRVPGWTLYDKSAQFVTTMHINGVQVPFYLRTNGLYYFDRSATDDDGGGISWWWTSGKYDLSGENRTAITRESRVWGNGTVTLQVANDAGSLDTGSALTLGSASNIADAWQQIDREGTLWQHKLSGSSQGGVNRLVHYVSSVKDPEIA